MKKTIKHSKPYKLIVPELDNGFISEGRINAIRRALHTLDRKDNRLSTSSTASGVTHEELGTILDRVAKEHPRIMKDQAVKGLAWLKNKYKSPTGKVRKQNPFSAYDIEALEDFQHFALAGFENVSRNYCAFYVPIYRVQASCGKFF